jgi:transcriptional regulator with XRE-family HTH domain
MQGDGAKESFGQRLRQTRGSRTQAVFAALLGIDPKTLGLYERGERWPDMSLLIRLKEIATVDLNWLALGVHEVSGQINTSVLLAVIQAIEEETPEIDPQSKAKLISRLYSDRIKVHSLGIEADPLPRKNHAS